LNGLIAGGDEQAIHFRVAFELMKQVVSLTALFLAASIGLACADEVRSCDFDVKPRCTSGSASVTLADGTVKSIEVTVVTCGLRGRPGYSCTVDASAARRIPNGARRTARP